MSKFIRISEYFLVSIVVMIFSVANLWHVLWFWLHKPPGTMFIGITHYYEDYFYYLSIVKQGMMGSWLTRNLYTTEAIPQAPLWTVNILIGKLGSLLGLTPWTSYDLAVVVLSVLWLVTSYWVIRCLVPKQALLRIGAFLIALISSPYYLLQVRPDGALFVNPYLYFYNYTSAFNRIGGVAHLILQNVLSLLAIYLAGKLIAGISDGFIRQKQVVQKSLFLSGLLTALFFINPSYILVDVLAITIVTLMYFIRKPSRASLGHNLFIAFLCGSSLTVSYLIVSRIFSHPFYRYFRDIENAIQPTIPDIFFHSMGIILIPAAIGLIPYLLRKDPIRFLGFVYVLLPIMLYFTDIPRRIGIPYFRLHQPPAYIFLGLIAADGIWFIAYTFQRILKKHVAQALFGLTVTGFVIFHLPMLHYELTDRLSGYWLPTWLNSMDKYTYDGLMVLAKEPKDKAVLAFNNLEILVPAFTGHSVYVGHKTLTYDYAGKIATAYRFYNLQLSNEQARTLFQANAIGYVLWHKPDGPDRLPIQYPILNKIFENEALTIYRVGDI